MRRGGFYLGVHEPSWLASAGVPLFVSRRRLARKGPRKTFPRAAAPWVLDSGGFTELSRPPHRWELSVDDYVAEVEVYRREIGRLAWVAPQDWMVEPWIVAKTGLTVAEHQRRTVANFVELRQRLGALVVPVVQGWTLDDYLRCWDLYHRAGVDLEWEPTIGLGSVCRRQDTAEAAVIVRGVAAQLAGVQLHGFGVKSTGLEIFGDCLTSADSMAWSFHAKQEGRAGEDPSSLRLFDTSQRVMLCGATHPVPHRAQSCANCLAFALKWRDGIVARFDSREVGAWSRS